MAKYSVKNAETEGKDLTRRIVNLGVLRLTQKNLKKNASSLMKGTHKMIVEGLSLPSNFGVQETQLQKKMSELSPMIESRIDGVESDSSVYKESLQIVPPGMQMLPRMSFSEAIKCGKLYDWIWYDSCGFAMTGEITDDCGISHYIQACKNNLKERGTAFYTCSMMHRKIKAEDQYFILTGKRMKTVPYDMIIDAYKKVIMDQLPKGFTMAVTVLYPSNGTVPFLMFGITKGWYSEEQYVNLVEGESYKAIKTDLDVQEYVINANGLLRHLNALKESPFLKSKGVEEEFLKRAPNIHTRTLEYWINQTEGLKECLVDTLDLMGIAQKVTQTKSNLDFKWVYELRAKRYSWENISLEMGKCKGYCHKVVTVRFHAWCEENGLVDPYNEAKRKHKVSVAAGKKAHATRLRNKKRELEKLQGEVSELKSGKKQERKERARQAVALYNEGVTMKKIAKRFGVSVSTAWLDINTSGLKIQKLVARNVEYSIQDPNLKESEAALLKEKRNCWILRQKGLKYREIAEETDIPQGTVYYYVERYQLHLDNLAAQAAQSENVTEKVEESTASKEIKISEIQVLRNSNYEAIIDHYVECGSCKKTGYKFDTTDHQIRSIIGLIRKGKHGEPLRKRLAKAHTMKLIEEERSDKYIISKTKLTKAQIRGYRGLYIKQANNKEA
jgi:transposase